MLGIQPCSSAGASKLTYDFSSSRGDGIAIITSTDVRTDPAISLGQLPLRICHTATLFKRSG